MEMGFMPIKDSYGQSMTPDTFALHESESRSRVWLVEEN